MGRRTLSLFLALAILPGSTVLPGLTEAMALFRCGDRIQQRPCDQQLHSYKRNVFSASSSWSPRQRKAAREKAPATGSPDSPEVLGVTLTKLEDGEGVWRGRVAGDGQVALWLHLTTPNQPEEKLYMGSIGLKDSSSSFAYRAVLPKSSDWDWKITASSGPLPE